MKYWQNNFKRLLCGLALTLIAMSPATPVCAQVDTVVQVVAGADATNGKAIGSFGYNPTNDTMYVASFGFSMGDGNAVIRRIENVSGVQTATPWVSESQMRLYLSENNPAARSATSGQSGFLLNPSAIGSTPAYSMAMIVDFSTTSKASPLTGTDPEVSKRLYRYDLQQSLGPGVPTIFTTDVTLGEMNTAAGAVATNTSSNTGRQFAWSGDGQSVYYLDTSSAVGGLWKYQVASGNLTRLFTSTDRNTEPAVVTSGGVDTIYFEGGTGSFDPVTSTTVSNAGGIDFVTHDGTTTGVRTVRVSAATIKDFMETTTTPDIFAMTSDAAGNIYFGNTINPRRGIYRLDPQGRLSKVMGATERASVTTTAHANTLRMQPRTIQFDNDGSEGPNTPFAVTQIMFADSTTDGILGANVFKPGDFNRDNAVTSADMDLFKAKLTVRGVVNTTAADLKFDMNGNDVVDWKDVKVLQQFANFPTGDTDMHGVLDYADLDIVGTNYGLTGKKWTEGDFASIDPLYAANAADANTVNQVDLLALANTWLNVLQQPVAKHAVTSRGYTGQFLTDVLSAFGYSAGGPGDFNGNGVVDGADYVTFRDGYGVRYDDLDYADWRANFGVVAGAGVGVDGSAVPEPGTALLVLMSCASCILVPRRERSRLSC